MVSGLCRGKLILGNNYYPIKLNSMIVSLHNDIAFRKVSLWQTPGGKPLKIVYRLLDYVENKRWVVNINIHFVVIIA